MRRLVVLVLAATLGTVLLLGATAPPAAAHICPVPALIAVGQPATVAVGVTVENATVPDVEITLPAGLELDGVDAVAGWTSTRTGATVRYHGGPIAAFKCQYFPVRVTAPARGTFGVAVVQRTANGTVVARSEPDPAVATDRVLDQIVYAGVKPPGNGGSGGVSAVLLAGIALLVAGAAAAGVLAVRARRGRGGDDDELRDRLERFRARTPRSPPDA